jgi:hypothetical protein
MFNRLFLNSARAAVVCLVLALACSNAAFADDEDDAKKERSFVSSIAATVYAAAWPTATFKDWSYKSFNRVAGGGDLVVRLKGESGFGGELWLDLAFEFRNGSFSDIRQIGHNAILVPPFETTKTLLQVAAEMTTEYAQSNAPTASSYIHKSEPAASLPVQPSAPLQTRSIRMASECPLPLSLWIHARDSVGRWQTNGAWPIAGEQQTFLADSNNVRMQLSAADVYFYAELHGADYIWNGEQKVAFGDRTLPMRAYPLAVAADGVYEIRLQCNNLPPSSKPPPRLLGILPTNVKDLELLDRKVNGVRVSALMHDYPAVLAGIRVDDVITEIDGVAISDTPQLQKAVASAGEIRAVSVLAWRGTTPMRFTIRSVTPPVRQAIDPTRCRQSGNPPDYYLGALGAPFSTSDGTSVTPLHPLTQGRLFDPSEVDLYFSRTDGLFFFYGKPLRDDIASFEYRDADRVILAVLSSGERLDLGVRAQCLIHPGVVGSTNVHLTRTQNGKVIADRVLPLKVQ